jgi:hypothetical protein
MVPDMPCPLHNMCILLLTMWLVEISGNPAADGLANSCEWDTSFRAAAGPQHLGAVPAADAAAAGGAPDGAAQGDINLPSSALLSTCRPVNFSCFQHENLGLKQLCTVQGGNLWKHGRQGKPKVRGRLDGSGSTCLT